ncbi:protein kinase domain-containing protein [Falsarthrobacter nasiphocae]|uniref:non-specific serine/threonine protein kinase n=1 Tax=Falsarthrobacter nasiphocae TaxID=189863 RepID=A0AAE3YCE6_9MICC|nr:protein kinase [Falsarthrobacter nasiphocae]MDR6891333.1 hypothetical protein [Falsarthrobacter nasiphocae]
MTSHLSDERRLVGATVDGRYEILSVLGVGGMATVYEARDTRLGRAVAVKVISPALGADESFLRRFDTEARASARLAHPNVVHVLDRSSEQSLPYIVFELVRGRTLRSLIKDEAPLQQRQALLVWRQLIEGLAHAHESGIIHRDVKPDNVLVSERGVAKLTDFGLARAVAEAKTTRTIMGTARYVAPEVIADAASDVRSDLYSAGILLFELLTGDAPFTGANPINVAYAHVHRDVPEPSVREPGIHPEVDSLVTWCCARSPEQRPQSALDVLSEVDHILSLLPAEAPRPRRPRAPRSPGTARLGGHRHPQATTVLGATGAPPRATTPLGRTGAADPTTALGVSAAGAATTALGGPAAPTQALGGGEAPTQALGRPAAQTRAFRAPASPTVPLAGDDLRTRALARSQGPGDAARPGGAAGPGSAGRVAGPRPDLGPLLLDPSGEDEPLDDAVSAEPLAPAQAGPTPGAGRHGASLEASTGPSRASGSHAEPSARPSRREAAEARRSARRPQRSVRGGMAGGVAALVILVLVALAVAVGVTLGLNLMGSILDGGSISVPPSVVVSLERFAEAVRLAAGR